MHVWPFYGLLAAATCYAAWRDGCMRELGVALLISCALSNAATWLLSPAERPAAYTVCEALIMSTAFLAFVCGGSRWLIGVVAVSIASVGFNLVFAVLDEPTRAQVSSWQLRTNVCFFLECLIVLGHGVYARTRAGPIVGRDPAVLHGRASASSPTP